MYTLLYTAYNIRRTPTRARFLLFYFILFISYYSLPNFYITSERRIQHCIFVTTK